MEDALPDRCLPSRRGFAKTSDGFHIHYWLYEDRKIKISTSETALARQDDATENSQPPEEYVFMIPGIATDLEGWKYQIEDLLFHQKMSKRVMCCVLDNRGIGSSSIPTTKDAYTTERMAQDVIETADVIGWECFHCMGFSMGGMIACKVAACVPHRLKSLVVLSTTGGGWQIIPRNCFGIFNALMSGLCCGKRMRAFCDLRFHFTSKTLNQKADRKGTTQWDRLMKEYVRQSMHKSQSSSGLSGQLRACWHHVLTFSEIDRILHTEFPVLVIHGRHDRLAHPRFGMALARRLGGRFIEVDGAHLIKRECRFDVSQHLIALIDGGQGIDLSHPSHHQL